MTKHRQSSFALTLMTVAAFMATTLASSAVTAEPPTMKDLSKNGPFKISRSQASRPEHQDALILVLKTRRAPNAVHDLIFLQTTGDTAGEGISCRPDVPRPNATSSTCGQRLELYEETLTVGAIGSTFCEELRNEIEECVKKYPVMKAVLYTSDGEDGKNPVMDKDECGDGDRGPCVCFEIRHDDMPVCDAAQDAGSDSSAVMGPPSSGTGSGGHN